MSINNAALLGFDTKMCDDLRDRIIYSDTSPYVLSSLDKSIVLRSFAVFLSEVNGYETISLTDHTTSEVQMLYKKLQQMYGVRSEVKRPELAYA